LRELDEPLILGLDNKEDFKSILEGDPKFRKEIEAYFEEWSDSIYDICHNRWIIQ
jgi:hypothetical protein